MQFNRSVLIAIAISGFSQVAIASIFEEKIYYFEPDERNHVPDQAKDPIAAKDGGKKKFEWNMYLDPERDDFFKEGDYIPPAPFMEAMRRPTQENILLFEKWQEKKNLLLERYEAARGRYLGEKSHEAPIARIETPAKVANLEKYRFVFYFDSSCPSCKAMFTTINKMIERGIYVEAVRVDSGKEQVRGLTIPWSYATASEIKAKRLSAVPFLMVFDDKAKKVYRLTGKKTMEEISQLITRAGA